MKHCYFLVALVLGLFLCADAQQRCASYEVLQQQMANDPVFARKVRESERSFAEYQRNSGNKQNGKPPAITIPVVVHILYNTPEQNISDAQVASQIDVMNEDFTATNDDYNNYNAGYGAVRGDADIEFCLVQTVRKSTSKKSFGFNDHAKFNKFGGSDAVNPMNALNIWVCNLGQNLLGYAQFPGGAANTFGVVCHYQAFGRGAGFNLFTNYNLGRTMTHEVGHCLGLRHIWGDSNCGNDFVDDTPLHNTANFGCPGVGHLSTCVGTPLEMTMNYMDYTDDLCMYFFSDGQVSRANFFIDTDPQIQSILNSSCTQTRTTPVTTVGGSSENSVRGANGVSVYPSITNDRVTIEFSSTQNENREVSVYDLKGSLVLKQVITARIGKNIQPIQLGNLRNGIYLVQLVSGGEKTVSRVIVQH